jgi:hypothetical protein
LRLSWTHATALAIIATLVAFSLGATAYIGSAVPQNDDWSYVKAAILLQHTGHPHLQGWGQMFLLGQLYTAQPFLAVFGDRTISLNLYGAAMGALWLWCIFIIGRRCLGPRRAVLLVAVMALWPGLGLLVSSFMTDIPACATSLLAIVLGIRAIERESRLWLVLALIAGVWSFTIREQLVASLGAVLLAALVSRGVSRNFKLATTIGVSFAAVVCFVLEHFRHQLPHADVAPFGLSTLNLSTAPETLLRMPFTIGFEFAPVAVWVLLNLRGRDWINPGRVAGWVLGIVCLGTVTSWDFSSPPRALLTNYLTPSGAFTVAVVGRPPPIVSGGLWHTTEIVAAVCGVILLGEIGAWLARLPRLWGAARSSGPATTILASYTAVLALATIGLSLAGQRQVDRYLLPILPGIGVILLLGVRGERLARPAVRVVTLVPVAAAAVLLAVLSVNVTVSSDRRDHAVWATATHLVKKGVPATTINAGLDWNGTHAAGPVERKHSSGQAYLGQHWTLMFPSSTDCYVVAVSPLRRRWLVLIGRHRTGYQTWTYYNSRCGPRSVS